MKEKFPFLKNFELIAEVDDKSGRQCLSIQHIPTLDFQSISCIHTAVMDVSLDDFEHMNEDDIKQKIVSSESRREIHLEPEEKFKAFKSWTAGIAEAGIDAFKLQSEIEGLNKFQTPISSPLLAFVAKHDDKFFDNYLRKIEKECQFEGLYHEPCMMANLDSLAQEYCRDFISDKCKKIISIYPDAVLKNSNDYTIISFAENPNAVQIPEYRNLFDDEHDFVRIAVSRNPNALQFPEFKKLFDDKNNDVRWWVAQNLNAVHFPEYQKLFNDKIDSIRIAVAKNQNAVQFPEYHQLFDDKNDFVRLQIAKNPNAVLFPEFENLLKDKESGIREIARMAMEKNNKSWIK